jgi:alkylhydroperoxidase/carboxymuconolactone decarboxylase family protein YurZ
MEAVERESEALLGAVATGDSDTIAELIGSGRSADRTGTLDLRTAALVRVAALIALDAPPVAYASQVALALESGASAEDLVGVLRAVAPIVGAPKVVAAAPEVMLSLGLSLPDPQGDPPDR